MTAKTLMIQGTASSVGKSIIVAALCRIFKQDGLRVAPFKSQNMALNSFVTKEGGEIGRAQVVQAEAAGIEPTVDMNPVLLKPEADSKSQVIVLGKVVKTLKASEYYQYTPHLIDVIQGSLNRLRSAYDIVVIEGAGSPAEINLKEREIVNMRIARMAGAPVLLAGDIDRGGVFAALVGTLELLTPEERDLVKGFIINKFRGDISLLKPGLDMLEARTSKPVLGVVPYFRGVNIAQEDSVYLDERAAASAGTGLNIAVIRLPHISNYDDFDPFEAMNCAVNYVTGPAGLNGADIIILPGTKSTIADLEWLRRGGLADAIAARAKEGVPVIGVCGGFQMLGTVIDDPDRVESAAGSAGGLGLIDVHTTFQAQKTTTQVKARIMSRSGLLLGCGGLEVTGYEIHMGQTAGSAAPVFKIIDTPAGQAGYSDGFIAGNGLVFGTYIHGLFHNPAFTAALLDSLRRLKGLPPSTVAVESKERHYDELARIVRGSLDMKQVYRIALGRDHA